MTPTRKARPRLECLEDRAVPATFAVTTTLDEVNPGDGKRSLREAVSQANKHAGTDAIVLPAGVFRIALAGANENANATGDLDIHDAVTVRGAGAGLTIINGQQLDRVFDVFGTAPGSIRVVLDGLTVCNGSVTVYGGGVLVGNANLVVRDSAVIGNRAALSGGGVSNGFAPGTGDVKVVRSTVARNVAGLLGGGLSVANSSLTVKDGTVRRNAAGTLGGGIFATSVTLTGSTVSGNSAGSSGGGVWATTTTVRGSTVGGNTAGDSGGGVIATTATLTGSTVNGNTAGDDAGGIYAGTAMLTNVTVSGNTAGDFGGGVWAATATLLNVTVAENVAHTGGGVYHNVGGAFTVRNTIIALNLVDFTGTGPDVYGAFTSGGHNLIGGGTGGTGFANGVGGDIVGTSANPADPKLGPLANNGGRTRTHALLAGSRAIDAGGGAGLPGSDQRGAGFPRVKDGNGDGVATVDIGAFER
jgi:hypothetical protein